MNLKDKDWYSLTIFLTGGWGGGNNISCSNQVWDNIGNKMDDTEGVTLRIKGAIRDLDNLRFLQM